MSSEGRADDEQHDREARAALHACRDYDRWAAEIKRLTAEIKVVVCPMEYPETFDPITLGQTDTGAPSCFREARDVAVPVGPMPDSGSRNRRLDEVAAAVADCPECSLLCAFIGQRRAARRKLGAAKRAVRRAGRPSGNVG